MKHITQIRIFALLSVLTLINFNVKGQQEPMYTQYMYNTLNLNPGYTGSRDALSFYLLSRSQWIGFNGAPSSQSIALHTPFYNEKQGIGASFTYDQIGPSRNTYFNLNYAYRLRITKTAKLSLGIRGGINNYSIQLSDVYVPDNQDPYFGTDVRKSFAPNIGFGAYYYTDKYYVGFSIPKLFETTLDGTNVSVYNKERRHYFLMAGYVHTLNSNFKIKPTVMAKIVSGAPASVDLNVNVLFRDRLWFGVMHRLGDAVGVLVQYKVTQQLSIGYSFDQSVSRLNSYNNGTHEIMLSFDFEGLGRGKIKSPRYF